MSAEGEAQARLLSLCVGELVRLTWDLLALENLLVEKGVITRNDRHEEAVRVERGWEEGAVLEGLADPEIQLLVNALRARGWRPGWRPPAREGETS